MPRISRIAIFKQKEQPTLVIRQRTKVSDLPALIGRSYQEIGEYMGEHNQFMTDVPFVAYHNMDMQNLDVEIGFPLPNAFPGKGDIQSAGIVEGLTVSCMYQGAYHAIEPTYLEIMEWIGAQGYQSLGASYEYYYNGPEEPESELLTKIVIPIKPK